MIKKLVEHLKKKTETVEFTEDMVDFNNKDYEAIHFSKENYFVSIKENSSSKKIAFIDGGNAEIIKKSNQSVQLIRLYYTIYQDNKRIEAKRFEYFCVIGIKKGRFNVEFFSEDKSILPDKEDLALRSDDATLKEGNARANVSKIGNVTRLFSEYILAKMITDRTDYIVMDGTLQGQVTNHKKYIDSLINNSPCTVCALSKSTKLVTILGQSLTGTIKSNYDKEPGIWYYHPILKEKNDIRIYIVNLSRVALKCFRFEINGKMDEELLDIISKNSQDPTFPGYPYGLIEADTNARVSNEEREYYHTIIGLKARINPEIDSHSILDSITF